MAKGMGTRMHFLNPAGEEEGLEKWKDLRGQQWTVEMVLKSGIRLL